MQSRLRTSNVMITLNLNEWTSIKHLSGYDIDALVHADIKKTVIDWTPQHSSSNQRYTLAERFLQNPKHAVIERSTDLALLVEQLQRSMPDGNGSNLSEGHLKTHTDRGLTEVRFSISRTSLPNGKTLLLVHPLSLFNE